MSPTYIVVLAATLILGHLAEANPALHLTRDRKCLLRPDAGAVILLSAVLIFVSGLRYRVGVDFGSYYNKRVTEWSTVWNSIVRLKEPVINVISFISRAVWDDGQSLIFLSALITVGLYCWTIYRYHSMYLIGMLLYLFLGEWQGSFNGVRQYLAAAVLFAGHRYIFQRKLWQYCLVVCAAALFHTTALVMIVPYFLFNRKPDITQLVILFFGAIIIRFSYNILFDLIGIYKGKAMNVSGDAYLTNDVNIFRILVAFIPVVIYIFLCNKENHTKEQDFYINALFFNAFSMLAGMGSTYLARIGIYTGAALSVGYGYLLETIENERSRKITIYIVMLVYLLYWVYSLQSASLKTFQWAFNRP